MRPGLQYGVSNTTTGFRVTVSGYSHKLLTLLGAVVEKIVGFEVLDDRFEVQDPGCAACRRCGLIARQSKMNDAQTCVFFSLPSMTEKLENK